jgi:ATP-dependent Clp protease ATP-binding subunit ClpC
MFGRFTERAQQVILLAQEEAKRLKHTQVGTEHILLGLLMEGQGISAKILTSLNISIENIKKEVEDIIGIGNDPYQGVIGYTPRAKRVLELALEEARALGHNYIGTEHILLGLLREGEGVAAQILTNSGLDLTKTKEQVIKHLGEEAPVGQTRNKLSNNNTPTLNQYGRDLTQMAEEGKLDPVIGRDEEIQRVIQVLSRRTKNNPCLIGEPGVGKTAIAEGLAQRIFEGNVPEILKDKRVVSLDLASMVAGSKYRGEFEDRLKKVMAEILEAKNIILFIDEMHTIIGAGAAEGAIDASNILKPALSRGELQAIGATTLDEFRKHVEKDPALERRFQPITVDEPTAEQTLEILKGLRDKYEAHHRVKISDESLAAAVKLSHRYVIDRYLPDKAIDLIDEAASKVRLKTITTPASIKEMELQLEECRKEKEAAVKNQEFEKAAQLRDVEKKIKQSIECKRQEWQKKSQKENNTVEEDDIAQIVSSWTGIPVSRLAQEETEKLLKLEETLHGRVIGQDEAVKAVSKVIRRARSGLKDPRRPIGSFMFLGPTGVGKTELAKALAETLFGQEDAMIRIDMSEFMERHTVSRLVGSPPGYVGYDEGGQLTEKVRRKPYSVILLDEIEKAHPDVFNILLQIMDDGRLTDAKGRKVDFRNTIIIMTSNVGANLIRENKTLGFVTTESDEQNYERMKDNVMKELRRTFRPEFLNRLDDIIVFHGLTQDHLKHIIDIMLSDLQKRLKDYNIKLGVNDKAKEFLTKIGFDPTFGARPLRRVIQKEVEDRLSDEMLRGTFSSGDEVIVDLKDDKLIVSKK